MDSQQEQALSKVFGLTTTTGFIHSCWTQSKHASFSSNIQYCRAHQNRLQFQNSVKPASFLGIGAHPNWLQLQFDSPQLASFTAFGLIETDLVHSIYTHRNSLRSHYAGLVKQVSFTVFGIIATGFIILIWTHRNRLCAAEAIFCCHTMNSHRPKS